MSLVIQIIVIAIFFAVFYFLLIRPQVVRQRERKTLIESLEVGDKVITVGGIIGEISALKEDQMILKTGQVGLEMSKGAVASKMSGQKKGKRSK